MIDTSTPSSSVALLGLNSRISRPASPQGARPMYTANDPCLSRVKTGGDAEGRLEGGRTLRWLRLQRPARYVNSEYSALEMIWLISLLSA